MPQGDRVRRMYDVAQTPLQRLLASGVLSENQQRDVRERVQRIDPLTLSEQFDALLYDLLCSADGRALPQPGLSSALFSSVPRPPSEEKPERTDLQEAPSSSKNVGHLALERTVSAPIETLIHGLGAIHPSGRSLWKESWPPGHIQGDHLELLSMKPNLPEETGSDADQYCVQAQPLPTPASGTPSSITGEHVGRHLALTALEQAIAAYVLEMRATGRAPKTLQWHQTSLSAMLRSLRRQFHLKEECSLSEASLRTWLAELSIAPSARTGSTRTINTVAAYARSARAFCNWLVRQGYVSETPFPQDAVPKAQRGLPQAVEPEVFVRLLRACQLPGSLGGLNAGLTARNRAILWLLLDTGLQVSELCGLHLADVDRTGATVTVRGKKGHLRTFPLSEDGQRAVSAYLDLARLTSAWEPTKLEAQDRLLLTERRHPLTTNSLTLLLKRLSQRAGFIRTPICPSMLRDTYAIRFVQAGGDLTALREQLGIADLVSVKRYQHFCQEREAQGTSGESLFTRQSRQGKGRRRKDQGRGRGHRRSS